ncbi:MAG TPA: type II toxin-antitoxin system Phd/YefM family antitoxin [Candidatus Limnocylindria bacterium]|jgi:prevent-host-death family protein|nr:type II toxin-antitoxin system Phd/YefM family antitoxin [Candidatus Limnocylindria bacterium]
MKSVWPLQDAKNQFSRLVDSALSEGPQTVTRHGEPTVMVISVAEFKRISPRKKSILELFEPVRGIELDVTRDRSVARDVNL